MSYKVTQGTMRLKPNNKGQALVGALVAAIVLGVVIQTFILLMSQLARQGAKARASAAVLTAAQTAAVTMPGVLKYAVDAKPGAMAVLCLSNNAVYSCKQDVLGCTWSEDNKGNLAWRLPNRVCDLGVLYQ